MKEITISLGSNISPEDNLKEASCFISKKFKNVKFSKIYSSKSEGFEGKDFLNQVIDLLKKIEVSMGRKKEKIKFSDRLIDLDLLTYGEEIINNNGQEVPHKDIEKYPFVLVPLVEICPSKIHPLNRLTFKEMLLEKKDFLTKVKLV
jgi:2-amino-4-hydroxy-6-hydroxymethyldihydropteridine diphosphokinase